MKASSALKLEIELNNQELRHMRAMRLLRAECIVYGISLIILTIGITGALCSL